MDLNIKLKKRLNKKQKARKRTAVDRLILEPLCKFPEYVKTGLLSSIYNNSLCQTGLRNQNCSVVSSTDGPPRNLPNPPSYFMINFS